ncbi:MAG: hypothetical protein RH942_08255 [Kiloniellaceae bacterium]
MSRSLLLSTLAAAAIALPLAACDQQDASDSTSVPMQQQGAAPSDSQGSTAPLAPEAMEPEAMEPEAMEPQNPAPGAAAPEGSSSQ